MKQLDEDQDYWQARAIKAEAELRDIQSPLPPAGEKRCGRCKEFKSLDEFGPNRTRADGYQSFCRFCQRKASRESDRRHRDRKNRQRAREPFEEAARGKLRDAVKSGAVLKPKNCEGCGTQSELLHGHHHDYTKPLEVEWLCARCHRAAHPDRADALDRLIQRAEAAERALKEIADAPDDVDGYWLRKLARAVLDGEGEPVEYLSEVRARAMVAAVRERAERDLGNFGQQVIHKAAEETLAILGGEGLDHIVHTEDDPEGLRLRDPQTYYGEGEKCPTCGGTDRDDGTVATSDPDEFGNYDTDDCPDGWHT